MIKALGSLMFYARFLRSFSALGYQRRSAHWPPIELDFSGQTWLVTGATGGIGRAIALTANAAGATVLAAARDPSKLKALQQSAAVSSRLVPTQVDLSSLAALRELADGISQPVDVLVNNVGVLLNHFSLTDEGIERSFATNLLGHYVLTEALHARGGLATHGAVINMSSGGMYGTALKLAEMAPTTAQGYDGMAAYAMHKRAQVELTRAWNAAWKGKQRAYVMHPGWADTDGVRSSLPWFRAVLQKLLRDADQAADTALWLAHARPEVGDGGIWLDRAVQPEHEFSFTARSPHSADDLRAFLAKQAKHAQK